MTRRLLFLLLLVAGCSAGGDESTTASTTVPATTTTTTEAPTTTSATITTSTNEVSEACLVGDWRLDTDSFATSLESAMSTGGGGEAEVEVTSGGGFLSLAGDGTANGGYEDLTVAVDLGVEGAPQLQMVITGEIRGAWSLVGDTLTLEADVSTFDLEASVGGQPFDVPIDAGALDFGASESTVACDDERLTIDPRAEGVAPTVWFRT